MHQFKAHIYRSLTAQSSLLHTLLIACSQSPIFPCGFRVASIELPPSWFVTESAIWGECLNDQGH